MLGYEDGWGGEGGGHQITQHEGQMSYRVRLFIV